MCSYSLPVQEKLEHKIPKMQSFLNIGKELVNLRDLRKER